MPRLDRLAQINRNTLLTFPAQVNDTTPFVAPGKPLPACRVAIVTTASNQQLTQDAPIAPTEFTGRRVSWRELVVE